MQKIGVDTNAYQLQFQNGPSEGIRPPLRRRPGRGSDVPPARHSLPLPFESLKSKAKPRHPIRDTEVLGNNANFDTKCTPGSRWGAFYSARGAFFRGGVQLQDQSIRFFISSLTLSNSLQVRNGINLFISSMLLSHHLKRSKSSISSVSKRFLKGFAGFPTTIV